jgi:NADH pyrophosphatase NudC (nudix superfamily)
MKSAYRFCPLCASTLALRSQTDRERLACDACGWVHWDNPTPVVAALIEFGGRVLLARNRAWPPKMFGLVTGFLERGESPRDAVAREVAEETGLVVREASLIGVYDFERMNEVIIAWHVVADGAIELGEELAEFRLIEPAKLRPWPMGTGFAVADWMKARGHPVEFLAFPE